MVYNPSAKAGLEMALYDLVARGLGTSLGTLFGGRHRAEIPCSRLVPLKSPEEMAAKCKELAAEGYATLKLKLSGEPALDRDRIAACRAALGPAVKLTLDPNQAYSAKGFLKAWASFEPHDIALVEQPVPAHDIGGLALVTRELPVAVEADESAASLADVTRLARERTVDVINLKVPKLGGVQATLAAIAICEANGIGCRFGASFGPVAFAGVQRPPRRPYRQARARLRAGRALAPARRPVHARCRLSNGTVDSAGRDRHRR